MEEDTCILSPPVQHLQLNLPVILYKLVDQVSPAGKDNLAMTVVCKNGMVLSVGLRKVIENEEERLLLDITASEGENILEVDGGVYRVDLGSIQSPVYLQTTTLTDRDITDAKELKDGDRTEQATDEISENSINVMVPATTREVGEEVLLNPELLEGTEALVDILASGDIESAAQEGEGQTDDSGTDAILESASSSTVNVEATNVTNIPDENSHVIEDNDIMEIGKLNTESSFQHHDNKQSDQVQVEIQELPSVVVLQDAGENATGLGVSAASSLLPDGPDSQELEKFVVLSTADGGDSHITEVLAVSGTGWWPEEDTDGDDMATIAVEASTTADTLMANENVGRVTLMSSDRSSTSLSSGEIELASSLPVHHAKDIPRILKDLNGLKCNVCSKVYSSRKLLKGHYQRTHSQLTYCEEDMVPVLIKDAFLCYICHQPFRRFESVRKHLETFHKMMMQKRTIVRLITCPICQSRHSSYHTLRCHLSYKHRNDPKYSEALVSLQTQSYSQKTHKKQDCILLQCPWCELQLTMKQFRHHVTTAHNDQGVVDSIIKDAKEAIRVQKQERYKQTTKTCKICQTSFPLRRYYTHMRKVHQFSTKPLNSTCDTCGKVFSSSWHLNMHALIHTGEKNFPCDQCTSSFRTKYALKSHVNSVHLNIYPHMCEECGRGFHGMRARDRHRCDPNRKIRKKSLATAEGEAGAKSQKSGETDKETSTVMEPDAARETNEMMSAEEETRGTDKMEEAGRDTLTATEANITQEGMKQEEVAKDGNAISTRPFVRQSQHLSQLPSGAFMCLRCEKEYPSRMSVSTHLRRVHRISRKPIQQHECTVCDKSFMLESKLRTHMAIHNEASHFCSMCNKAFKDKYTLKSHIRVVHERKYTLRCDKCGKGFEKSASYDKHCCKVDTSKLLSDQIGSVQRDEQKAHCMQITEQAKCSKGDALTEALPMIKLEDSLLLKTDGQSQDMSPDLGITVIIKSEPDDVNGTLVDDTPDDKTSKQNHYEEKESAPCSTSKEQKHVRQTRNLDSKRTNALTSQTNNLKKRKTVNQTFEKAPQLCNQEKQNGLPSRGSARSTRERNPPSWLNVFQT